jgi:hypothetical protein
LNKHEWHPRHPRHNGSFCQNLTILGELGRWSLTRVTEPKSHLLDRREELIVLPRYDGLGRGAGRGSGYARPPASQLRSGLSPRTLSSYGEGCFFAMQSRPRPPLRGGRERVTVSSTAARLSFKLSLGTASVGYFFWLTLPFAKFVVEHESLIYCIKR